MLPALTTLLLFQLIGEVLVRALNLTLPGPVLGMVASSLAFGALLADFSQIRLIQVIQGAALLTMVLNVVALWKQEARDPARTAHRGTPRRGARAGQAAPRPVLPGFDQISSYSGSVRNSGYSGVSDISSKMTAALS